MRLTEVLNPSIMRVSVRGDILGLDKPRTTFAKSFLPITVGSRVSVADIRNRKHCSHSRSPRRLLPSLVRTRAKRSALNMIKI